ncbi:MAG: DUF1697 domain-containing protein [Chloroflexales bacterium]|nr:DUF1697 domain-containing protein [Chloroflexales bacterium]
MQQYIALLRGINVGGHRVSMTDLRQHFAELGFANVTTFIASGNVIFDSAERDAGQLEATIAGHLQARLGYEVATFLRTPQELAAIAACAPFSDPGLDAGTATLSIMFLPAVPPAALHDQLQACETPMDALHVHGREIYWLCRGKTMESLIDWPRVGKAITMPPLTVRNATTVRKLATKYGTAP